MGVENPDSLPHLRIRNLRRCSSSSILLPSVGRLGSRRKRKHAGTRVLVRIADLDVRILTEDGELLRALRLNPSRDYQPQPKP